MITSDKGIEMIKSLEGRCLQAYKCSAGVWTIGYGHTAGVSAGDKITEQKAEQLLREDLLVVEEALNRAVTSTLQQCQFDALVSFAFNVGTGNLRRSTLLKVVNDTPDAVLRIRSEFAKWVYVGNLKSNGLILRRHKEADMYEGLYE